MGGDPSPVLELVEQALDLVAPAILDPIMRSRVSTVAPSRDHGLDLHAGQGVTYRITIIAFVREQSVDPVGDHAHQWSEALRVVRLSRAQHEGERATSDIAASVEFGGEAAARSDERLGRASPFFMPTAQWCARTTVLSIMSARSSRSTTPASVSSMASNTPVVAQRR